MNILKQSFAVLTIVGLCCIPYGTAIADQAPRTIEIHAKRYQFAPSEITIKKGETVKLEIISDDVSHSLSIPGLNVKGETVSKGHPTELTITADKTGDFKGQCGHFCGMGHGKMVFTVHVTE